MFLNLVILIVYIINFPNDLLYLFLLLISCVTHHLVLFIMIFGVLLLLRQSLLIVISCYLLMITLVLLGFIFLKYILLCPKFILVLQTWFVLSVLKSIKIRTSIMLWSIRTPIFFPFFSIKALLFNFHVLIPLHKMVEANENIVTSLTISMLNLSLPLDLRSLGWGYSYICLCHQLSSFLCYL